MAKKNPYKLSIAEWKTQHAEIVKLIEHQGFVFHDQKLEFNDLIFFDKDMQINMDLGKDIIGEILKAPQINYPRELLDKYGISMGSDTFFDKTIARDQSFTFRVSIRLKIQSSIETFPN
jgi:hypothetical protein